MNISELQLQCNDIKSLNDFYYDVIGLVLNIESDNSFTVNVGKSNLTFTEDKNTNPYYHFAINIPQNQINEAIEWLKPKVNFIESNGSPLIDFPNWNARSVYFYDPAGNIIELIARHDLDNSSTEPFSSSSFLNISEVGMPVADVKVFHDMVNSSFGENLWSGNLETFAAIGDEDGLFIVVTTHRNWFPTNKPCNIFPLTVKIANRNSESVVLEHPPYTILAE